MIDRARDAIEGHLDPAYLTQEERSRYYEYLDGVMANPTAEQIAAAHERGMRPGAIGYDEYGRLVRRLPDGRIEVIDDVLDLRGARARLARVWPFALEVWQSQDEVQDFLFRPHPLIEDKRPIDVIMQSESGADRVLDILGRLKQGTAS